MGSGGVGVPDHATVDVGLAHLPTHGVEVGLVFGPDLLGEGVGGVVGGGGDVGVEVEQQGEGLAHHGVAVEEEEGAAEQQAQRSFDEAVAEGGRAVGCGEAVHGVGFAQQLAASGLKGLVGLLVAGDLDAGCRVGEPHGAERHAGHRLVEITAAGGEAVDDVEGRAHPGGLDWIGQKMGVEPVWAFADLMAIRARTRCEAVCAVHCEWRGS